MKKHFKYLVYLAKHKWFVFVAGLVTGAPLWRLIIHDWSKFTPMEWGPYVRRFYSGRAGELDKSGDPDEFLRAWNHHWHLNPHHWEHWLSFRNDPGMTIGEMEPLEMPDHFVREMVADWCGAGRAITGAWTAAAWYSRNQHKILLHAATRAKAERYLDAVTERLPVCL